jgi:hypothetical protein
VHSITYVLPLEIRILKIFKVKQFQYRPEQALRVPRVSEYQISK